HVDCAEERVFEQPVKLEWRIAPQKISEFKPGGETGGLGLFDRQTNGTWRDIETHGVESGLCPGADIVTGATAWHAHGAARQIRVGRQKIHEPRRRRAFFPGHVFGLVTFLPILAHGGSIYDL